MDDAGDIAALLRRDGPMNLERAYAVMEEFDIQGLILSEPVNLYHVLGYWPQIANTRVGQPPTSFVLLARDSRQAPGLVTTRFIYYYTYADGGFEREIQAYLYLEPGDQGDDSPVAAVEAFIDRGLAPLTPVEVRRDLLLHRVPRARASIRDAGGALVRAMREMGLWRGRIGFDHALIAAVCARHDHPGQLVQGDNLVREIRLVKSPLEIMLLRRAAAANVEAVGAVGRSIRAGASYRELCGVFDEAAARLGNRSVFVTIDRVSSELSDERIRDGQTLFIDGVSHYRHYHGDYARAVFIGEPTAGAQRAVAAAAHGWNSVRECLRPGMRYSELVTRGRDAVRKAGFDVTIGFGPHSVGLMHTDEPCDEADGFYRKRDIVLRENMIVSIDCPVMDTGLGGSAHIEDLMLITANGAEPIHEVGPPVLVL